MIERFHLNGKSLVVELASNDGYLLQYFVQKKVPVLGIEPAANVAKVAVEKRSVPTLVKFFGEKLAKELAAEGKQADLLLGNNVLAQVPDLCDFVAGMKALLKPQGVLTMEFPHLLQLIENNQFDTIYHEHFSYFSFLTTEKIFAAHGARVLFGIGGELPTHGGSLRIYGRHRDDNTKPVSERVIDLKAREEAAGLANLDSYRSFAEKVKNTKRQAAGMSDQGQAGREDDCRIRRSRQRQHAAELLRRGRLTSSTTPSIAILTSTASSLRALTFRFFLRSGFAKPGRITC